MKNLVYVALATGMACFASSASAEVVSSLHVNCTNPGTTFGTGNGCAGIGAPPQSGYSLFVLGRPQDISSGEIITIGATSVADPSGSVPYATAIFGGVINSQWGGSADNSTTAMVFGDQNIAYVKDTAKVYMTYGTESDSVIVDGASTQYAIGEWAHIDNESSSVIPNAYGLYVTAGSCCSGGSITNAYGIEVASLSGTNVRGINVEDVGSSNYAIYTGTGQVHFGGVLDVASARIGQLLGRTTLGDTTGGAATVVQGHAGQGPYVFSVNLDSQTAFAVGGDGSATFGGQIYTPGGFRIGNAVGGYEGAGTINMTGAIFVNGVSGATCAAGTVDLSQIAVSGGVVVGCNASVAGGSQNAASNLTANPATLSALQQVAPSAAVPSGSTSFASGAGSFANGDYSLANGVETTAVGASATASADHATALGVEALASNQASIAAGYHSQATGSSSAAFGDHAMATADNATALGELARASGLESTSIGANATAAGASSTSIGGHAQALGDSSDAFGNFSLASAQGSSAIGLRSEADGLYSTAMGAGSLATGDNAIAIGGGDGASMNGAHASGTGSIAVGAGGAANGPYAAAFGASATASGNASAAYGYGSTASGAQSIAGGTASSASGANASAYGSGAQASGAQSSAFGTAAQASGASSVAMGDTAEATQAGAVAVGQSASATGVNAIAIGHGASATGSVAVGNNASAANGGAAFGDNAAATGSLSTAVGPGASATGANAVAIGSGSVASANNTVSFGTPGNERRLTNVAPGVDPTDAVNLSQLNGFRNSLRSDVFAGVAAGVSMTSAPTPSGPGKTTLSISSGFFENYTGVGMAFSHRLNTDRPINIEGGFAHAGGENVGRVGMSVEF